MELGPSIIASRQQDEDIPDTEEKELVRFERADEYLGLLRQLVPDSNAELRETGKQQRPDNLLTALLSILDEYQEQSYLLDPYLDVIVSPPVEALQKHIKADSPSTSSTALLDVGTIKVLSKLVYTYTKIRGYKTIINFFPHEVSDLSVTLTFLERLVDAVQTSDVPGPASEDAESLTDCWELRYVVILWLSLICMIPFDLGKFDEAQSGTALTTAARIEAVGLAFIVSPGKERDAAAVLLGKLFQRQDVVSDRLASFIERGLTSLRQDRPSPFAATGILQALCEIVKISSPHVIAAHLHLIQSVLVVYDEIDKSSLLGNALVLKYRTKLVSRIALKLLRPRQRTRLVHVKILGASADETGASTDTTAQEEDDDEDDVPEEVEDYISLLISALQHKDTLVRYSAAKGLARICDRLPRSFISQVCDAIVSLFQIGIPDLYEGANDLSSVSEHTWQGSCMALAELARRGLLFADELVEKMRWIEKALLFDVRRGAHSVGANVRDSACYVIWALARAHDPQAIRAFAPSLANKLVAVATLDRDVSIRRAASAAFQESVGRLDLFPHGLEVIRLTDFYAVSVRKNAFLDCAVQVAKLIEYRDYLVHHLLHVTILHWDPQMRTLGAKALALIAAHDLRALAPSIVSRLATMLHTTDVAVLHGVLSSLAEICEQCREITGENTDLADTIRARAIAMLDDVAPETLISMGAALILAAACRLIGSGVSSSSPNSNTDSHKWQKILNIASARMEESVQIAAADAVGRASQVLDMTPRIRAIIDDWSSFAPAQQQSNSLALGSIDYVSHVASFESVVQHLLSLVDKPDPMKVYSSNIETRRNAFNSMTFIFVQLQPELTNIGTAENTQAILNIMLMSGLNDYTSDQRGDVGSWVRLSCVNGIRKILVALRRSGLQSWVPQDLFSRLVAGLWKQAAERIDHVRQTAVSNVLAIYAEYRDSPSPTLLGYDLVRQFDAGSNADFKDPKYVYQRLVSLLQIAEYRKAILEGLVISVASKSDLGDRVIGLELYYSFCHQYDLPESERTYTIHTMLQDLFELGKMHFNNNRIFVPVIQTVNIVIDNGGLSLFQPEEASEDLLRLFKMACSNIRTTKNMSRVLAAGMLTASIAPETPILHNSVALVLDIVAFLLSHTFPTVRAKVAELLCFSITTCGLEMEEDPVLDQLDALLLDTKWAAARSDCFAPEANAVVRLLAQWHAQRT